MKLTPRAAVVALIATTATAAALLPFSGPALASSPPPTASPSLLGTWANTNAATRHVADIVVTPKGRGILVDGFGACAGARCEWGNIRGTVFGASASSVTGNSFEANWNFGYSRTVLLASLTRQRGVPTLVVKEFTTFIPPDHRANYAATEKFVQARRPITPKTHGRPATGYPAGNWVKPVKSLLGTWKNMSPMGGIAKIVLTRNRNGSLSVHAFGQCGLTLCNWGLVQGITFGRNIASVNGRTFLAPYKFTFKKALLSGSVNSTGTSLTVQNNSEFTDTSGRSNYVYTATFTRP